MSTCRKCTKWFPHNWLCLKGLAIIFLVMFYLAFIGGFWQTVLVIKHPAITGSLMYKVIAYYLLSYWGAAIGFLTIAKILQALREFKPCRCGEKHANEKEEPAK